MKTFALLVVLFFAEGVENPTPQFVDGIYPMIVEEERCEELIENISEYIDGVHEQMAAAGQVVPLYTVSCDPIAGPTTE